MQQPKVQFLPVDSGIRHNNIISQEAINFLTDCIWANLLDIYTPTKLMPLSAPTCLDHEQVAMAMVHPITGETICSYKQLMRDPTTAETYKTAFRKDFGGMAQGNLKMGQKGTNSIFVMTHNKILQIPHNQTVTYARVVVNFLTTKGGPHRIWITVGRNLINYPGELSTRTADITTSQIMWNSILSTEGAMYMCVDLMNFYFSAPLDRYKYMKNLLALFPDWVEKTIQSKLTCTGRVCLLQYAPHHLGAPPGRYFGKQVTMQKTSSTKNTMNAQIPPACGNILHALLLSLWL
jgi:hypothetical protein